MAGTSMQVGAMPDKKATPPLVEATDSDFLARYFGSGIGPLYEGEYGCNLYERAKRAAAQIRSQSSLAPRPA